MSWNFFWEALLRSLAVLLAGESLLRLSGRQTPVFRHRVLVGIFLSLAALPVLCVVVPSFAIPVWPSAHGEAVSVAVRQTSSRVRTATNSYQIAWPFLVWSIGLAIAFLSGFV